MADDEIVRLHAIIDGHVQGVGFRFFVRDHAERLKLTGWVRNTYDGQVELVAEGPRPALEELLDLVRQGPHSSFVTSVQSDWEGATGQYCSFSIAPSY
jgi:acylphosphatase